MRFLIVDDEEMVRTLLCELLEDMGHEAADAPGGAEGLELFARDRFDAVITDIGMPKMSGWEFAHVLRERSPHVPVVVITGWGETVSTAERARTLADCVLTKPFSMGQIAAVVDSLSLRLGAGGPRAA